MIHFKNILFLLFCIFFISCQTTNLQSVDNLNEDFEYTSIYKIKSSFDIPSELMGIWESDWITSGGYKYTYKLTIFNDNTYLCSFGWYKYVGVYYTCVINNENYIQFNPKFKFTYNDQTFFTSYKFNELDMEYERKYKFNFESDKLILSNEVFGNIATKGFAPVSYTRINEVHTIPKKISENHTNLNSDEITLYKLRELSKKSFIDYYENSTEKQKIINLLNDPKVINIDQNGFYFTINYPKPNNWPANLQYIGNYTFYDKIYGNSFCGSYNVAYQLNYPTTVIQWIDERNCLLMINSYTYEFSELFWCNTELLGNVYNKERFSCTYGWDQLFFQYLGTKTYKTSNGFTKTVPEIKLFYANLDSAKPKEIQIEDLYMFFEELNLNYFEKK